MDNKIRDDFFRVYGDIKKILQMLDDEMINSEKEKVLNKITEDEYKRLDTIYKNALELHERMSAIIRTIYEA